MKNNTATLGHRVRQLLVNGLKYEPIVLLRFFSSFLIKTRPIKINQYDEKELLLAIKQGKSLIRFGDGEAMLLMGRDIHFQPYSPELRVGLRCIIKSYSIDSPYIIGILIDQLEAKEDELRKNKRLRIWRLFRVYFNLRFLTLEKYCSSILFYHQNTFELKVASLLSDKKIICVSNANVLNKELREYFSTTFTGVEFITVPDYDAFAEKDYILQEINHVTANNDSREPIVLFAAGPASKILVYELANNGIQALDIGHGMEIIGRTIDYSKRI